MTIDVYGDKVLVKIIPLTDSNFKYRIQIFRIEDFKDWKNWETVNVYANEVEIDGSTN